MALLAAFTPGPQWGPSVGRAADRNHGADHVAHAGRSSGSCAPPSRRRSGLPLAARPPSAPHGALRPLCLPNASTIGLVRPRAGFGHGPVDLSRRTPPEHGDVRGVRRQRRSGRLQLAEPGNGLPAVRSAAGDPAGAWPDRARTRGRDAGDPARPRHAGPGAAGGQGTSAAFLCGVAAGAAGDQCRSGRPCGRAGAGCLGLVRRVRAVPGHLGRAGFAGFCTAAPSLGRAGDPGDAVDRTESGATCGGGQLGVECHPDGG